MMALWALWGEACLVGVQGLGKRSGPETLIWVSSLGLILICQNYSINSIRWHSKDVGQDGTAWEQAPPPGAVACLSPINLLDPLMLVNFAYESLAELLCWRLRRRCMSPA